LYNLVAGKPRRGEPGTGVMDRRQMQPSLFGRPGVSAAIRILQISKQLRENPGLGYATAFISVGVASGLQWLAQDQYAGSPFLTIYPAVIVTALVGGTGAGFLAAALAGGSQWGFFIPTFHWIAFLSYAFDATVCVMLIDFINRTLDILLINIDREKQAKQHQYLLAKELHHRIQNLFTVIQAVIRFSLPGEGMVRESAVKQRLMDRLQSMSATNRAITDSMGDGVRLNDLISSEIRGFESRFEISGNPRLVLGPQMTQNLSLILHELLTNALKYGALSVPQGRVNVRLDWTSWVLTFVWQERGGPSVLPPEGSGFGSRILGAFAKSFCQNVDISYARGGLRYTLQIHSDQNSCVEPALVGATATDAAGSAPENTGDAREPQPLLDRDAEFEEQRKVVLHDWQLYHAGKEG
jgi:two-component sensor histidine kinase